MQKSILPHWFVKFKNENLLFISNSEAWAFYINNPGAKKPLKSYTY